MTLWLDKNKSINQYKAWHFPPNSIMDKTILKWIIIAVHFYNLRTAQDEMWG